MPDKNKMFKHTASNVNLDFWPQILQRSYRRKDY